MSDEETADGWWQASDGKWYPPETHPSRQPADENGWRRGTFSVLPDEPAQARAPEPVPSEEPADAQAEPQPAPSLFSSVPLSGSTWSPTGDRTTPPDATAESYPVAPNLEDAEADTEADETEVEEPAAEDERTGPVLAGPPRFVPPAGGPDIIYGSPPPPGSVPPSPPKSAHDITIVPPPVPEDEEESRRWPLLAGAAAALVLIAGVAAFFLTRGGDEPATDETATVASETTVKEDDAQPGASTADSTAAPAVPASDDPDAACREALLSDDEARPFQICTAYQFRRLQPVVAPERTDLDTACRAETLGDACIFIPTTLPAAPFQPSTHNGQGNGSVPMPAVATGAIVEVQYSGSGPITLATATGQLATNGGAYTGRHYVGDVQTAQALQVSAQGPWTITIMPTTSARDATLRAVGNGPDVLRIDNPTEKQVRFTYDGSDHFMVIGHPMMETDPNGAVAVDQPGPVDATVVLRGNIIEIRGTGRWAIIPS